MINDAKHNLGCDSIPGAEKEGSGRESCSPGLCGQRRCIIRVERELCKCVVHAASSQARLRLHRGIQSVASEFHLLIMVECSHIVKGRG